MRVSRSPTPRCGQREVLVTVHHSVISPGTERSTVAAAKASLVGKARQRPDLVKKVVAAAQTRGLADTYKMVRGRLDSWDPLGYSVSGVVLAVGSRVEGLAVGDRVACGGAGYAVHAEIVKVPANLCVKVPAGVLLEHAAMTTIAAIALQGLRQADLRVGEVAIVVGMGLVGQLTALLLRASGVRVFAVELAPEAAKLAREQGFEVFLSDQKGGLETAVGAATEGQGADAVLVCAATRSSAPVIEAAEWVRQRGTIVVVGAVGMNLPREPFYLKEIDFKLSCSYGPGRYDSTYEEGGIDYPYGHVRWTERRNMSAVVALMESGALDVSPLQSHSFAFDAVEQAYDLLDSGAWSCAIRLDYSPPAESGFSAQPFKAVQGQVKIGIVGAGNYVRDQLLPALNATGAAQIAQVATGSGFTAVSVAERFGVGQVMSSSDEIFADGAVDAVVIGTRHGSHARLASEALRASKHVFVEKPLALTWEQLDEVEAAWRESGRLAMVGFNRSQAPLTEEVLRLMPGGPRLVSIRVNAGALPSGHWLHDLDSGGGRLLGEGCHFVDLALRLLGGRAIEIGCQAAMKPGRPAQAWDDFVLTLRTERGGVAVIAYSGCGGAGMPKEQIEAFGAARSVVIDDFTKLTVFEKGSSKKHGGWGQDKGQRVQMQRFIDGCRGQGAGARRVDFERAIDTSRVCLSAIDILTGQA